jgi:hypothetical protein
VAEVLMVVEVLVPGGEAEDALREQGALGMGEQVGVARIGQAAVEGVDEAQAAVGLAEQQGAGVGGEGAAGKIGVEAARAEGGEGQGRVNTLCHSDGPLGVAVGLC